MAYLSRKKQKYGFIKFYLYLLGGRAVAARVGENRIEEKMKNTREHAKLVLQVERI